MAELKQLVSRPDVVEMHDVTARDPRLLVHHKSTRQATPPHIPPPPPPPPVGEDQEYRRVGAGTAPKALTPVHKDFSFF